MKTPPISCTDFKRLLIANGFVESAFCSLNSWGLGSDGVQYNKDSCRVLIAHAYCRVGAANTSFVTVTFSSPAPVTKAHGRAADAEQSPRTFGNILRGLRKDLLVAA